MKPRNETTMGARRSMSLVHRVFLGAALVCAVQSAIAQDAKAVLNSMSDYVTGQKTIELTFDSDIEVITPDLEKIQFTNSGEVLLRRPDKMHAHRVGGYSDVELFFNGKTVSIFGRSANSYATFEVRGTVDQLIDALRSGHGIALPGADLLLSNAADVLLADVTQARYMGRGVIDGVQCEHLAFRNADTDWQLWIEVGTRPIPRKMVITSKAVNGAPQYTVRVKQWEAGGEAAPDAFVFARRSSAEKHRPDQLVELDELPQGLPAGGHR